ncbi:PH domain-containing protein [Azotobacter salinestris]|uniref:PH domain-containing protein n=1 Tax=Azotobacter salinestris TaxID=69964 RepID=UPI0032DFE0B5
MQCPACHYEPTLSEHEANPDQCPSCGRFYAKIKARQQEDAAAERARLAKASRSKIPSYIRESLSAEEWVEAVFRLHWASWISVWILGIFSLLTFGLLAPLAIYQWLSLRSLEQGVTNKRLIVKRGIISRKTEEMKLSSIETVELQQGVLGRLLGFGNVKATGRGISDVVYRNVDDPISVKRRLESICHPID